MNAKKNVPNFTDKGNGGILWKVFQPRVLEVRYENGTDRKISMGQRGSKKRQRQVWSADTKLKLISRTVAVESVSKVAESIGIGDGMLHQWICKQKTRHQMNKQANLTPFTASRRPFLSA